MPVAAQRAGVVTRFERGNLSKGIMTTEREAIVAIATAIGEQLDVDRLLVALHTQCLAYRVARSEDADKVAALNYELGQVLTALAAQREQAKPAARH